MVFFVRPGSWSVSTCDESIVLPSGSLSVMFFDIITGEIFVWLHFLDGCLHLSL